MGRERLARYSLMGPEAQRSREAGLADGDWFRSPVPRKRMKELMSRSDHPAILDTFVWLGALVICGVLVVVLWGTWLVVPFLLAYGLLYGTAAMSRWHECAHGTPFRTRWMNDIVYKLASFMMMVDPTVYRWTHTRHHTDTLILGLDPEIEVMRPARLARLLANFFGLFSVPVAIRSMVLHAAGRLTGEERLLIPEPEQSKVFRTARVWLTVYAAAILASVLTASVLPVLLIGGPRLYGAYLAQLYDLTQHSGMGENVLDHRLNTRTIYMSRINRFLYLNMNYHVEHHIFPMVPYHRLPELHDEIKHDLAAPYPSLWAAYREIVPAVLRQLRDQTYYVHRELPPGAAPYHFPSDGRALPGLDLLSS
jgi:fatty acid desaturase